MRRNVGWRMVGPLLGLLMMAAVLGARASEAAVLTFIGSVKEGGDIFGIAGAHALAISPGGDSLYVAAFSDNSVASFGRDLATGQLTFVDAHVDASDGVTGLMSANSVSVSPDGANVYVSGLFSNGFSVFRRDPSGGSLSFVEAQFEGVNGVSGLTGPKSIVVSPDGADVYVASSIDSAVAAFRRDPSSGALQFTEVQTDGVDGVTGLLRAAAVRLSSDGTSVYAAAPAADGLAVFSRDAATGRLTFVEAQFDGVGGVGGLTGATAIALSADDWFLYAVGDSALTIFQRDPASGALHFVDAQTEGVAGGDGSGAPSSIAVSPDGGYAYVTCAADDALSVFRRDSTTGRLQLAEVEQNLTGNITGLAGANAVVVSPDSRYVYVAGGFDDAVAVFRVAGMCVGDCDGDGAVTVDEIIQGVNVGLGTAPLSECPSFDANGDGQVTVDELVTAVNNALTGCAA